MYASMFASVTNVTDRAVFSHRGCSNHVRGQGKHCSTVSETRLMPGPSDLSTLEFQGVQSLPVHTGQEKSIIRV